MEVREGGTLLLTYVSLLLQMHVHLLQKITEKSGKITLNYILTVSQ